MRRILLYSAFMIMSVGLFGQGATTSSIRGKVSEPGQGPVIGANVTAIHVPTGTFYGTSTDVDGTYRIDNMVIGGPYKLTFSFVGFEDVVVSDVSLRLGQPYHRDIEMGASSVELDEVVITAQAGSLGGNTGAGTQISTEAIDVMPTLNRSISDYTRLTPQANGNSFAGTNNRFNAIFVDGAVNNDVFGLSSSGTNGGQTGSAPFSIDIIDQIQVVLSPYDVTFGGFAGGGVNMVTKSGTNLFKGTAYYFLQNESLVGKTNGKEAERLGLTDDQRTRVDDFTKKTYGASLGGPIIKDKLFFFTNVEIQQDVTPAPFETALYTSQDGRASVSDLENLRSTLMSQYNYDPGTFGSVQDQLDGVKVFGKLNYNISDAHKLVLRHSYTKAEQFNRNSGNANTINFSNNGVFFPSITNSSALELNSTFSPSTSNKLIIGYTSVNDDRGSLGTNFPFVFIEDNNRGTIRFGTERFSTGNVLEQKILTLTDNLKIYKGKHTWTLGTHNEFYDIRNVFIPQNFGTYRFSSLEDFLTNQPAREYDRSYSLIAGDERVIGDESQAAAEFKAVQLGFYAQDEIEVSNKFKLTAGLRFDIPIITTDPSIHPTFATTTLPLLQAQYDIADGITPGKAPQGQLMISPRIGFEYLPDGTRSSLIRGGIGIFTSRVPFVWPGAMFNNNGVTLGNVDERGITEPLLFRPDPANQYVSGNFRVPAGQVDLFSNDFKYPQVLRGNLAYEKSLAGGWNVSLEGIYTKTLNNVLYQNINSDKTVQFNWTGTPDNRPVYGRSNIDPQYNSIYLGYNTSEGYTYNVTAAVEKYFDFGLSTNFSYTYGDATAINEGTSSQNSSQWRGQIHIDGRNAPVLGRSDFAAGSRILGAVNYKLKWNKSGSSATTISLFYDGSSGQAYSTVYGRGSSDARNLNNEAGSTSRNRSLIFVPASASQINLVDYTLSNGQVVTAAQQWTNLDALISSDPGLDSRRGQYAEKNASRLPFVHMLDLAIRQDIGTLIGDRSHKLQLSLDIFNLANLLNKDWGTRYSLQGDFNNNDLILFEGYAADGTTPQFTYRDDTLDTDRLNIQALSSRWSGRIGIRYIFD